MGYCDSVIEYIEINTNYTKKIKYNKHVKYYFNNKIFAIVYTGKDEHIILKANGKFNKELRKEFKETVYPSYVINQYHWNVILFNKELPIEIICRLIETSKNEVLDTMTRRQKEIYDLNLVEV